MAGENNNTLEAEESIIKPRPFPLFNLKGSLHEILGSGKALDLILWRRRNSSIGVIAVATTIWFLFEQCGYTLLSFVANVLMLLITILFLWSNAAAILNRPPPPLPELELSEETIYATSTIMHAKINYALKVSREIALGKDLKLFLKVAFVLLIMSTVGSWFDLLTIAYISLLVSFAIPALYDKYEDYIDKYLEITHRQLRNKYEKFDTYILSKVSWGFSKEKKIQ